MPSPYHRAARDGVILLVVLLLLTLFAVVGLSFVFYADAAARSTQVYREAQQNPTHNEVERLFAYFLGQLVYDAPDDERGVYSALRGHSLARSLYGLNDAAANDVPFNGTGRLHFPSVFAGSPLDGSVPSLARDDFYLVNYTYFRDDRQTPSAERFLRDPERVGFRRGLADARGPFTGGFNAPYTYPDLNNLFLAAVKADGTVLLPSFHRPWLFGSNDPDKNPDWTNAAGKHLLLRPRPIDMGPGFPYPEDAGGDVKNLVGGPGGNDSYWLDLDFPALTAPDGRKYKALFAPLVVDLDGRINVNVHGNVRGRGQTHVSHQGWGPWEVNPRRLVGNLRPGDAVWAARQRQWEDEWANLLAGTVKPARAGRYGGEPWHGQAGTPGATPGDLASFEPPHFYARIDFDACDETDSFGPSAALQLPGFGAPATSCFPTYGTGFGNASRAERTDHPLLYDVTSPKGDDRAFAASNLEALLRYGDAGSPALTSELFRLCRKNFGDDPAGDPAGPDGSARRRRLVTTHSYDVDKPGVTPWVWDPQAQPYVLAAGRLFPQGGSIRFPSLSPRPSAPPPGSEFASDWRASDARLGRIDVNRPLPAYPTPDPQSGLIADDKAFAAALEARVQLARDVYDRLRHVTGAADPAQVAFGSPHYNAARWLAQLAVNVVDYVDADDYLTPFFWDPSHPAEVVASTESPRVVLNEVYVESSQPAPTFLPWLFHVHVWAELHNPFHADLSLSDGGAARLAVGDRSVYQLVVSRPDSRLRDPANVLGQPNATAVHTTPDHVPAGVSDFSANPVIPPSNGNDAGGQGFYVAGPTVPFPGGQVQASLQSPALTYSEVVAAPGQKPAQFPTLLLRRLACPHRPASDLPGPDYNPFVTVDTFEVGGLVPGRVPSDKEPLEARFSHGRMQPYARQFLAVQSPRPREPGHTFFRHNQPRQAAFDWLVHLDRPLVSPMELLHVSAFKPHELTRQFMTLQAPFGHAAPWFNPDARLYRVFEFLETGLRAAGAPAAPGGRVPGKINLNTVWDPEILLALCDPQPANNFTAADIYDLTYPANPDTIFGRMVLARTPGLLDGGGPGSSDRPFLGLATGRVPLGGDLYPVGAGLENTLLRSFDGSGTRRLFEPLLPPFGDPNEHPYLRHQLLTKLFNHLTTRSNVFAVWLTVGFFEVTDDTTRPVKLGAEFGRDENRHRRHRLFAIVDRSNLPKNPGPWKAARATPTAYDPWKDPYQVVAYLSVIR